MFMVPYVRSLHRESEKERHSRKQYLRVVCPSNTHCPAKYTLDVQDAMRHAARVSFSAFHGAGVLILYHQTSPESAMSILLSGFRCGSGGTYGAGIYFADNPRATHLKAQDRGAILECRVVLGRAALTNASSMWKKGDAVRAHRLGFDSVVIQGFNSGTEYVVYCPTQVQPLRLLWASCV
mmetsp:Transcript_40032/g.64943  ORF Transcript_40032/g.64943 Transcript_40032/m.64943 type:complete len:180 (-) Transcript_40032:425-964(-)